MDVLPINPGAAAAHPAPTESREIGPADLLRMREKFLHWWHSSLECLVATQKLFRRFDDDDLTALYLAAWHFALDEMAIRQKPSATDRIIGFMTQLDASRFEGETVTRFAEVTGIPRETVRRKLDKAASLMLLERLGDSRFRLRAFSTDILPMFDHCLGLARTLLGCVNRKPTRGSDLSAPDWLSLMRAYCALLLGFWSTRRKMTRVSSAVSVQSAIELVTILKSYRQLAIDGNPSNVDLQTFLANAPTIRKSPYFIAQLAFISGLPLAQVRHMCRYLETQGKLEFLGPDAIRPLPLVEEMPTNLQQAFFSQDVQISGVRFVGVAMACLMTSDSVGVGHA